MRTFLNLFGRSPFTPLQTHMGKVRECVLKIPALFQALNEEQYDLLPSLAEEISRLEHEADLVKNDIRNHLPKAYSSLSTGDNCLIFSPSRTI